MQFQIIVSEDEGVKLSDYLRNESYACTTVTGQGKVSTRHILYVIVLEKD